MGAPFKIRYRKAQKMARLSKQQVLKAPLKTEDFEVAEWGGSILIGEWPVERTSSIMDMFRNNDAAMSDPSLLVKLFVMGCIDPVFTEDDIPDLLQKSGAVILRASQRIMVLNGLSENALTEARGNS